MTVAQLEHALAARVRVEQAIGVLAERHRLRSRQAFDLLRSVARSGGRRVIEVAEDVVDSASNPLLPLPEELARTRGRRRGGMGPSQGGSGGMGPLGKDSGGAGGSPPRASTECRGAALESWQLVHGGPSR